jgi:uncharacterized protein Yka (UPF0111/DUF47 family)/8-oxo-dGTP pyrophosphatase MutT (NUDIX family)
VRTQVGALPYRIAGAGRVEVLLITSRDTGRWVVPKGNPMHGFAPHEAAAEEAWEEAGVRGAVCPTPLGRYRYWKHRRLRPPRELQVSLYCLLVMEQAVDWPERHQRVTQWFDLAKAAAAVAEPELKRLIAGFREPPRLSLADRVLPAVRANMRRRVPMLGWFQSLLPKTGRFFELFEAHSTTLTAGAEALAGLLTGDGQAQRHIERIVAEEHRADDITREVLQDVRRIFVTPFDRSAITDLIGVMDDAIDQMNSFASSITLYEITDFPPQMRDMAGVIVEAARVTAEAVTMLRSVGSNSNRLHDLTARIIELEGEADRIHDDGLKTLFKSIGDGDGMRFVIGRELYNSLERVVDRFEDVANEIQGLVIDHA